MLMNSKAILSPISVQRFSFPCWLAGLADVAGESIAPKTRNLRMLCNDVAERLGRRGVPSLNDRGAPPTICTHSKVSHMSLSKAFGSRTVFTDMSCAVLKEYEFTSSLGLGDDGLVKRVTIHEVAKFVEMDPICTMHHQCDRIPWNPKCREPYSAGPAADVSKQG